MIPFFQVIDKETRKGVRGKDKSYLIFGSRVEAIVCITDNGMVGKWLIRRLIVVDAEVEGGG